MHSIARSMPTRYSPHAHPSSLSARTMAPLLVLFEPRHVSTEELISIKPHNGLGFFLRQNAHAAGAPTTVREVFVGLVYDRKLLLQERRQAFD